jgi:hypothetical protein
MKNLITKETEKIFNEGSNREELRKQFYTTGRCNKCGKGNIECKCPKLSVNWFDAIDCDNELPLQRGGKDKKTNSKTDKTGSRKTLNDIP